ACGGPNPAPTASLSNFSQLGPPTSDGSAIYLSFNKGSSNRGVVRVPFSGLVFSTAVGTNLPLNPPNNNGVASTFSVTSNGLFFGDISNNRLYAQSSDFTTNLWPSNSPGLGGSITSPPLVWVGLV